MTIAIRQTISASNAATATSITANITVLQGSSIHVVCACDDPPTFTTCTDGTNSYTRRDQIDDTTHTECSAQFTADNVTSGTYTVSANISSTTTNRAISVREITGTTGFDQHAAQLQATPGTGADGATSGNSGTTTAAASMLSGFCLRNTGSGAPAAGTGFTDDGAPWTGILDARLESKRVVGIAAYAATFTAAANVSHTSMVATFGEIQGTPLLGQATL